MASKEIEFKSVAPDIGQFNIVFEKDPYRDILQIQNQGTEDLLLFFGDEDPLVSGEETKVILSAGSWYEPAVIPTNKITIGTKVGAAGPGLAWCAADFGTSVSASSFAGINLLETFSVSGNSLGTNGTVYGSGFNTASGAFWSNDVMSNEIIYTEDGGNTWQNHVAEGPVASVAVDEVTSRIFYVLTTGDVYEITPGNTFSNLGPCGLGLVNKGKTMGIAGGMMTIASGDDDRIAYNTTPGNYTVFSNFIMAESSGFGFKAIYTNDGYVNVVDSNNLAIQYSWSFSGSYTFLTNGSIQLDDNAGASTLLYLEPIDEFDAFLAYWSDKVDFVSPSSPFTAIAHTHGPGEIQGNFIETDNGVGIMEGSLASTYAVAYQGAYEEQGTFDIGTLSNIYSYIRVNGFVFAIGGQGDTVAKFTVGF